MNPVVSIIVPCYNQAPYIAEALESVLAQTFSEWECIVMDDGSTDESAEIVRKFCEKDPRIRYFHQENAGAGSARNAAIARSEGEFLLPLDGDDRIGPTYLEEAVKVFRRKPRTKLVYCLAELFGSVNGPWYLPDYRFEELLIDNIIFVSALFRRSDYDLTGGYDEQMRSGFEDWDFLLKLIHPEDQVVRIEKVLFFYRQHADSAPHTNPSYQQADRQKELQRTMMAHHAELYGEYIYRFREYWSETRKGLTYRIDRKVGHAITKPLRLWLEWKRKRKYRQYR